MASKNWKNQSSKFQKEHNEIQYISKKGGDTQISVTQWDFSKPPKNWQFNVYGKEEARRGYPRQRLGIKRKQALKLLKSYMRRH